MNELTKLYQTINAVSQKVNDVNTKLDKYIELVHSQSTANIDYLSAMSGINIPTENKEVPEDAQ